MRGDLALNIGRNVVHGSDSVESAKRELAIYFGKDDLVDWVPANAKWVTE
ncbi:MAG TPA: nucleoside-diphosphate kinase [Candidatus Thermoplasmatota archaeon]|nr:nucleoside-diphosphate kinase [Candidatus Thermoplasmatota archaeon]